VRCGADDRQALEQRCRCITRPALANEHVQTNAAGQVVLKLKTAGRDGTAHWVMSPLAVVPQGAEAPAQAAPPAECEAGCARHRPARLSWAKLLKCVFGLDWEHGPNCGGELRIIAAILEPAVIEKILTRLGPQARAPPRAPARGQALRAAWR
jgi:hypothetical protein